MPTTSESFHKINFLLAIDGGDIQKAMKKIATPMDSLAVNYGGRGPAIGRSGAKMPTFGARAATGASTMDMSAGDLNKMFAADWMKLINRAVGAFALTIYKGAALVSRASQGLAPTSRGGALSGGGAGLPSIIGQTERQGGFDWVGMTGGPQGPVPPIIWEKAGKAKDKYKDNLEKLKKKKKETAKATTGLINKIVEMGSKLRSISRLMFYASMDMQQFANVILGPLTQGVRVFADYNKTLTQMWVNFEFISQSGDEAISILTEQFQSLADTTEFSRLQIAQAAAVFGTANVSVDEISDSLEELTALARINFMTMEEMATMMLKTMRRFGLSMEEASGEMWRLTAISQQTGESIQLVASQLGYASELGQELGYSFGEIAVQMTLLTEVYGSASIAGRRLSNVYGNLIAKGEEYGIQIRDMNGEMLESRDQIGGLADYLDLIADPLEQNQYLMQLFGTSGAASARAIVDAFKEGRYDEMMEDQGDATVEALKGISEVIQDQVYVSIQDLTASIEDFVSKLGESVIPALEILLPLLSDIIEDTGDWVRDNKEMATAVASAAIAMTALAVAMKGIGFAIEIIVALSTMISALGAAIAWVGAHGGVMTVLTTAVYALGAAIGIATAPLWAILLVIGLIIAAILILIGIVAGFFIAMENLSKTTKDAVKGMTFLSGIFKILGGVAKLLWNILRLIVGVILSIIAGLVMFGMMIGGIIPVILDLLNVLAPLNEFLDHLGNVLTDIAGFFETAADSVFDFLAGFLPGSPTLADRILEVGDALETTMGPMRDFTTWGRRLTASTGKMKAQMGIHYGNSTAAALTGMSGGGTTNITNVDAALIQDPEELAIMISEKQMRTSKNNFRSVPY